jgi:hypothetical protein
MHAQKSYQKPAPVWPTARINIHAIQRERETLLDNVLIYQVHHADNTMVENNQLVILVCKQSQHEYQTNVEQWELPSQARNTCNYRSAWSIFHCFVLFSFWKSNNHRFTMNDRYLYKFLRQQCQSKFMIDRPNLMQIIEVCCFDNINPYRSI